MAIQKKEYELSVWKEELGDKGNKIETKLYIIGAHDMSYLGRATNIKLTRKTNGTQTLTFQMPDRYFDNEQGKYVRNEFIDELYAERKIKFKYDGIWYEFFIKKVTDNKKYKSYIKDFTCTDAFIDELSRNGYGITFHEDLYNNVEEIGTFNEEILEDSLWHYNSVHNWGDFTEVLEEKLYRVPISCFGGTINAYKLHFDLDNSSLPNISNAFTKEERVVEMGDDLAREKEYFWDCYDNTNSFKKDYVQNIPNDGYVYIPYSCLNFCYGGTEEPDYNQPITYDRAATEVAQNYPGQDSLAIAPTSVDPRTIIQMIIVPDKERIEVDEAGVIVNKEYTYFLPLRDWNEAVKSNVWYFFEDTRMVEAEPISGVDNCSISHTFKYLVRKNGVLNTYKEAMGNKAVYYDGYLSNIGENNIIKGKKIQVSNRTEINISDEIDQYVTVYKEKSTDFIRLYSNPEEWHYNGDKQYRVCSKTDTRQIIPQLARNLIQNGINIKSTDGWELMKQPSEDSHVEDFITKPCLDIRYTYDEYSQVKDNFLYFQAASPTNMDIPCRTIINFGLVGQEKTIEKNKIYCIGIEGVAKSRGSVEFIIGEGSLNDSDGCYSVSEDIKLDISNCLNIHNNVVDSLWEAMEDPTNKKYYGEVDSSSSFYLFKSNKEIKNPYFAFKTALGASSLLIKGIYLFEAYTKGKDFFSGNNIIYRYSGRELSQTWEGAYSGKKSQDEMRNIILFEDDIMAGSTYSYQRYFIQRAVFEDNKMYDTFGAKAYISSKDIKENDLPQDEAKYTEDDYKVQTNYIDLNNCEFYTGQSAYDSCDCNYGGGEHTCYYQKFGYCPYRFTPEKHCRKVRTLKGEKSNRFNLIQEVSKIFECYPVFNIEHTDNGITKLPKEIFYMTEKGMENKLGFRYEKNLSNINRTIESDKIVTKLYVNDVDSEISKTGLCTIKLAEDNPSKDSFIIDFSYYLKQGLLNEKTVEEDLYGIQSQNSQSIQKGIVPQGYLKQLGYYNTLYDEISNQIINLQDVSYNELEANLTVNLEGIDTALQQIQKIKKRMNQYIGLDTDLSQNKAYQTQKIKYDEQYGILKQLIEDTYYTNGYNGDNNNQNPIAWFNSKLPNYTLLKEEWVDNHKYTKGILGQFNKEYLQIQMWKKEKASYLKQINEISSSFFKKYEPYLKEGTWSDSNFISDNAYYFGALDVAAQGAIPKVSYNITVVDLAALPEYEEDYTFNIADTTYIEDIGMFGVNRRTGLPNRLKVIISEITYDIDDPSKNSIKVQDFTTQFEDLFQQVTAAVQSLTYNENIYKRSSNFTSLHNVETDSLQGTLDKNNLTLLNTDENNIKMDSTGTSGSDINNHANKYKLNGQGLFFSNDGGVHWNVGVGPSGINADYIKVGTLDAGKIRIVDSSYIYFAWDKDGIYAYRDPSSGGSTRDYALYNRNGLSLIKNGNLRLRAGYSRTTDDTQGLDIGFYLYNDEGKVIFSTDTNDGNTSNLDKSARLLLKGEMFTTNDASWNQGDFRYTYSDRLIKTTPTIYKLVNYSSSFACETTSSLIYYKLENGHYYIGQGYRNSGNTPSNGGFKIGNKYYVINGTEVKDIYEKGIHSSSTEGTNLSGTPNLVLDSGTISEKNVYQISSNYYLTKESTPSAGDTAQGAIETYLNNLDLSETNARVFSIAMHKKNSQGIYTNNYDNIFTILKNGNLYLGGAFSNSVVPNIENSKLKYVDGKLYIDFNNILNGNSSISGSQTLIDYVKSQISGAIGNIGTHRHNIPSDQLHGTWAVNSSDLNNDLAQLESAAGTPIGTISTLVQRLNEFLQNYDSGEWRILLSDTTEDSEV